MGIFDDRPSSKDYFQLATKLTDIATEAQERDAKLERQLGDLSRENRVAHKEVTDALDNLQESVADRLEDQDAKLANLAALSATHIGKIEADIGDRLEGLQEEYKRVHILATLVGGVTALFTNSNYRLLLIVIIVLVGLVFGQNILHLFPL